MSAEACEVAVLAADDEVWRHALRRAQTVLASAARGESEPLPAALAVAVTSARCGEPEARDLLALVRRALVRSQVRSEGAARCLRALARAAEAVDLDRLSLLLDGSGRGTRIALTAAAECASHGDVEAESLLIGALDGALRPDAAHLLSQLCSERALDALAGLLRAPGPAGLHAASALVAAEDDPFAFEALCERLCESSDAVATARALLGSDSTGHRLAAAAGALTRWAARGVARAAAGHHVATTVLAAAGHSDDVAAAQRALGSDDDDLVLAGAQAAWRLGDTERARSSAERLVRRGPIVAAQSFRLLTEWADLHDDRALAVVRRLVLQRPVELARTAVVEGLAGRRRTTLHDIVTRFVVSGDASWGLEASRAVARLREPPAIVPPVWL